MTRKKSAHLDVENTWQLQDAKARLSELMRRAREVGPQFVTVHGREEGVFLAIDEYRRLIGTGVTGAAIVAAFQSSPYKEVEIEPARHEAVARLVEL